MFYAKATGKEDVTTSLYGQHYTVEWTQVCSPLKQPAGILPLTFKMRDMGAATLDYIPCGPRNVIGGFDYVFFAQPDTEEDGYWLLDEVNNQTGIFRPDEHPAQLAPYLIECDNRCHVSGEDPEDWQPMTLSDRIKAAEYAFEVHMTTGSEGCVQCILNQPVNPSVIEKQWAVNQTLEVVSHAETCDDYSNITPNKRYIALLERVEISGRPNLGDHLSPDEVNGQTAIYEVTEQILAELTDELSQCPAEDYQCPSEPAPTPDGGSLAAFSMVLLVSAALVF